MGIKTGANLGTLLPLHVVRCGSNTEFSNWRKDFGRGSKDLRVGIREGLENISVYSTIPVERTGMLYEECRFYYIHRHCIVHV